MATLTTIAYHWNQACMSHEVTEVECSLKAIEFWWVQGLGWDLGWGVRV